MRTRPLCVVCLLVILLQSIIVILKSGDSFVEIPASSVFYEGRQDTLLLKGQVYKKINKSNYQILYLKNNSVADQRLLIYNKDHTDIPIGTYIFIRGKIQMFERKRNPGEFDEALYYARQRIYGRVQCEKVLEVSGESNVLMEGLYQFKESWKSRLIGCIGEKNGGILAAMILGEKSEMDTDVKELYQNSGISHVLAISGLHISFIGFGIYQCIRRTGLGFLVSGFLAMAILTLYILMIGFSVSAMRAYLMLLLKIGADITGRVYDMLTAAMLGAAMTVCYQPLYLTDGGFFLSYGAILGIAILLPAIEHSFSSATKWMSGFKASLAINIMIFPMTLWFFYVFPTYSVVLNMFVLPLTGPVLGLGIVGSFLMVCIPHAGVLCLTICKWILEYYERICRVGSKLPYARLVLGQPKWWKVLLYYALLLGVIGAIRYLRKKGKSKRKLRIVWALPLLMVGILVYQPNGRLEITVLDVGQGDGISIRGPQGTTVFIDGGSSDRSKLGEYCIEPFLESQGIGTLDYAFITHGDYDHYSGIAEMLERQDKGIKIRNLVLPMNYKEDEALVKLAAQARNASVTVLMMRAGDSLRDGEMVITCLHPAKANSKVSGNEGSMVLSVTYGEFSMLCTGDIEGEGEELLTKRVRGKEYDVLKVAHHGSKYSTTEKFLKACSPEIAVISAGKWNSYGHPHQELLGRLKEAKCLVYDTRKNGAIILQTDGNSLTIR